MELVLDANIFIAGILKNGITRKLMLNNNLILHTSEFIIDELFKHFSELTKKADMHEDQLLGIMEKLIIESHLNIITKEEVRSCISTAEEISPDIDDVQYFATALKLNCAIWSNDKHLKNQKRVKIYSTLDILELF